jgi:excisionase family DNA binding protein
MSRSNLDALFADLPPRLGVDQVAELLGVSDKAVYVWLKNGVMPGYQVAKTWIILRDDLKDVLVAGGNAAVQLVEDDDTSEETSS